MPLPAVVFSLLGDPTGSSRALRQIRALRGAGYPVTVAGVRAPGAGWRDEEAIPADVRVVAVEVEPRRGPAYFLAAHRAMVRALRALPAGIVHASDLHILPAATTAARTHGARLVYDAREWYAGLDSSAGRPWVGRAWAAVESRWAPRADVVLTVNDAIAERLAAERRLRARPVVLPNVSDLPRRAPSGGLRALVGAGDAPIVLYQGLLREGRGLPSLVHAVATLVGAHLVLVGDGPMEDDLRDLVARVLPGRGHVLPFTPPDQLAAWTPDATVGAMLIEPLTESLRLALPNKLFEYAAAGVPVLAGAGVPPLVDAIAEAGAGEIVDVSDPADVVRGLRRLTEDPSTRARAIAGLDRLRARFDAGAVQARFLDVYASLEDLAREAPRAAR